LDFALVRAQFNPWCRYWVWAARHYAPVEDGLFAAQELAPRATRHGNIIKMKLAVVEAQ
jgi:hypothetical protein